MLRHRFPLALLLAGSLLLSVASCKKDDDDATPAPVAEKTLYERLGKVAAVSLVVDKFIANIVAETQTPTSKLARTFGPLVASGNAERVQLLRNNLIDQIGQATGGPLVYKGKSMQEAHRGMNITDEEFTALVTQLDAALNTYNVPAKEKTDLVAILGSLKGSIVGQ